MAANQRPAGTHGLCQREREMESAAAERVRAASGVLSSLVAAANRLALGAETLAHIFDCVGEELQHMSADAAHFVGEGRADQNTRSVTDFLTAWRDVGETGVGFATRMVGEYYMITLDY